MPYISAVLKQNGYTDITGLNLNNEQGLVKDAVQRHLAENKYDIIFTGGVSFLYHNVKDLINYIREVSDAKIVLGGGLVSARPELMLRLLKPDYIIRYEGEVTALELVRSLERKTMLESVDGLCFKDSTGKTVMTPPRVQIKNLDSIPYPDLELFGYANQVNNFRPEYIAYDATDNPRPYPIVASRGCTHNCTFCFHTIGRGYRLRSIENLMGEIKYAVSKYRANVIFFNDELFSHDKKRTLEFCRQMKEFEATVPWKITMMFNLRVDTTDDELLDAVTGIGCNIVGLGLESYSLPILKSMKKFITPEQIRKAVQGVADRNCVVQGSFIFGDPAETLETAQETLDFYTNRQDILKKGGQVFFIMLFPGSQLYEDAIKRGIIRDEENFFENIALKTYNRLNPINLTHLSESDFEILKNRVFTTEYITHKSCIPVVNDGVIYATCPFCGSAQEYRNLQVPAFVGCRKCNGRYYLSPWWYKLSQAFVRMVGFQFAERVRKALNFDTMRKQV
jgi:anaerobic magnesium-protoporphyrin IX monomethyl ester cyclase